jgi:hypothetical protein
MFSSNIQVLCLPHYQLLSEIFLIWSMSSEGKIKVHLDFHMECQFSMGDRAKIRYLTKFH